MESIRSLDLLGAPAHGDHAWLGLLTSNDIIFFKHTPTHTSASFTTKPLGCLWPKKKNVHSSSVHNLSHLQSIIYLLQISSVPGTHLSEPGLWRPVQICSYRSYGTRASQGPTMGQGYQNHNTASSIGWKKHGPSLNSISLGRLFLTKARVFHSASWYFTMVNLQ